jgi:hypothetical protein
MDNHKRSQWRWQKQPEYPGPLLDVVVTGLFLLLAILHFA